MMLCRRYLSDIFLSLLAASLVLLDVVNASSLVIAPGNTAAIFTANDGTTTSFPIQSSSNFPVGVYWMKVLERTNSGIVLNPGASVVNEIFQLYSNGIVRYDLNNAPYAFYKRLRNIPTFNFYANFAETWTDARNILNTDFEIYSTESNLRSGTGRWTYCNYNDRGVGFPRDCGPSGAVTNRWSNFYGSSYPVLRASPQSNVDIWITVNLHFIPQESSNAVILQSSTTAFYTGANGLSTTLSISSLSGGFAWVKVFERVNGVVTLNLGHSIVNTLYQLYSDGDGAARYDISGVAYAFYKRLRNKQSFNFYSNFAETWTNTNNVLNSDFELYSLYNSLTAGDKRWLFCNYNDNGVGFPRDCGPTAAVTSNWNQFPYSRTPQDTNAAVWLRIAISQPPTRLPSAAPSRSFAPTVIPSTIPSEIPTVTPTTTPTTSTPTADPSSSPSATPSELPTATPTTIPTTQVPTLNPSLHPSATPTEFPTVSPTAEPTTSSPTLEPSSSPSTTPSELPTATPTTIPTTNTPTLTPSTRPSFRPTAAPTRQVRSLIRTTATTAVLYTNMDTTVTFALKDYDETSNTGWIRIFQRVDNSITLDPRPDIANQIFQLFSTGIVEYIANGVPYNYYKRLTDKEHFEFYRNFATTWSDSNNLLNVNFEMYSTLTDARAGTNKWQYCNYNGYIRAYPYECGPTGAVTNMWSLYDINFAQAYQVVPSSDVWVEVNFGLSDAGLRVVQTGPDQVTYTTSQGKQVTMTMKELDTENGLAWVKLLERKNNEVTTNYGMSIFNTMYQLHSTGLLEYLIDGQPYAYYKRHTRWRSHNLYERVVEFWGTGTLNQLNIDFSLYSTWQDVVADTNRWRFASSGSLGVGFPGTSGPVQAVTGRWCSYYDKSYFWGKTSPVSNAEIWLQLRVIPDLSFQVNTQSSSNLRGTTSL